MDKSSTAIVIPARLGSSRLPDKPLRRIGGKALILWALDCARKADAGEVFVACADAAIAECVESYGGTAVMAGADCPSGTDRIWQALQQKDKARRFARIVNFQGDIPSCSPEHIRTTLAILDESQADIATFVVAVDEARARDSDVVKTIVSFDEKGGEARWSYALAFTRACAPWHSGEGGVYYHHIGIYAYRRASLERFVSLAPTGLERREKLEQLRALQNGMRIAVWQSAEAPVEINREEERARFEASLLPSR